MIQWFVVKSVCVFLLELSSRPSRYSFCLLPPFFCSSLLFYFCISILKQQLHSLPPLAHSRYCIFSKQMKCWFLVVLWQNHLIVFLIFLFDFGSSRFCNQFTSTDTLRRLHVYFHYGSIALLNSGINLFSIHSNFFTQPPSFIIFVLPGLSLLTCNLLKIQLYMWWVRNFV